MRKVTFTESALKRISNIRSIHFTQRETMQFQIELIKAIQDRLSVIIPSEGYKDYDKGPWSNTRRILVQGYKVYYSYYGENDSVVVKGIKAPGMK